MITKIGHVGRVSLVVGALSIVVACGGGPSGTTIFIGPVPTPTPTPTVTNVFVATSSGAIEELSPLNGSVISTFASGFGATAIALDASGDVFAVSGQNGNGLAKFAIGSSVPTATYPSTSSATLEIVVTPQGELIAAGFSGTIETIAGWQPTNTGVPDLTIQFTAQAAPVFVTPAVRADGTLYVAYDTGQTVAYGVFAPGATTAERTILEPRGTVFVPTSMAVASDGTLYVTEWNGHASDPFAGLYVYPPTGAERHVRIGAPAPVAVKLDTRGNVYVLNDNATSSTADTVHLLTEFDPGVSTVVRRITAGLANGRTLTVDSQSGLIYVIVAASAHATGSVERIVPGGISAVPFAFVDATSLALYDGTRATQSRSR